MSQSNAGKRTSKKISHCLAGHTLILLYDGTMKELKDIKVGDEICGVEAVGRGFNYTKAIVLDIGKTKKKSYIITLQNNRQVICSGEQLWLTDKGWVYTMRNSKKQVLSVRQTMRGFIDYPTQEHFKELNAFEGIKAKGSTHLRVKSIKQYQSEQILYTLITSTQSFIANGVVAYSSSL